MPSEETAVPDEAITSIIPPSPPKGESLTSRVAKEEREKTQAKDEAITSAEAATAAWEAAMRIAQDTIQQEGLEQARTLIREQLEKEALVQKVETTRKWSTEGLTAEETQAINSSHRRLREIVGPELEVIALKESPVEVVKHHVRSEDIRDKLPETARQAFEQAIHILALKEEGFEMFANSVDHLAAETLKTSRLLEEPADWDKVAERTAKSLRKSVDAKEDIDPQDPETRTNLLAIAFQRALSLDRKRQNKTLVGQELHRLWYEGDDIFARQVVVQLETTLNNAGELFPKTREAMKTENHAEAFRQYLLEKDALSKEDRDKIVGTPSLRKTEALADKLKMARRVLQAQLPTQEHLVKIATETTVLEVMAESMIDVQERATLIDQEIERKDCETLLGSGSYFDTDEAAAGFAKNCIGKYLDQAESLNKQKASDADKKAAFEAAVSPPEGISMGVIMEKVTERLMTVHDKTRAYVESNLDPKGEFMTYSVPILLQIMKEGGMDAPQMHELTVDILEQHFAPDKPSTLYGEATKIQAGIYEQMLPSKQKYPSKMEAAVARRNLERDLAETAERLADTIAAANTARLNKVRKEVFHTEEVT